MSASPNELARALVGFFDVLQQVDRAIVASLALLIYDWLICLVYEVDHIWLAKWSVPKVLYIVSRYYGPVDVIITLYGLVKGVPHHLCRPFILLQLLNLPILSFATNFVLCLRLQVLYTDRPNFVRLIYFLWIIDFLIATAFTIVFASTLDILPPEVTVGQHICLGSSATSIPLVIPWITSTILSLFFFVSMLYHFISSWKQSMTMMSNLMVRFVRDGSVFFFMNFAMLVIGAVMTLTIKTLLVEVPTVWLATVYSIIGSRLVLNLRGAVASEDNPTFEGVSSVRLRSTRRGPLHNPTLPLTFELQGSRNRNSTNIRDMYFPG